MKTDITLLKLAGLGLDFYLVQSVLKEGMLGNVETAKGPLADKIRKRLRFGEGLQYRIIDRVNSTHHALNNTVAGLGYKPYRPSGEKVYCLFLDTAFREVDRNGALLFQKPSDTSMPVEVTCFDEKGKRRVTIDPNGKECLRWQRSKKGITRSNRVDNKTFRANLRENEFLGEHSETKVFTSERIGGNETSRHVVENDHMIMISHTDQTARLTQHLLTKDGFGQVTSILNVNKGVEDIYQYGTFEDTVIIVRNGKKILEMEVEKA
ncbi:hypothetical protein SM033_00089 [Vibrio phage vB_VpaM_sm033]|nr:hypothetical protein SM033_00089 [Vibrio phage vB_VpaM_sm033]